MVFKVISVFFAAVATCVAQEYNSRPACGCTQQPIIIQMTCGGGAVMPPTPPTPPVEPTTAEPFQGQFQSSAPTDYPPTDYPSTDYPPTPSENPISLLSSTNPSPCYADNELAIVIDSSGSVGQDNYKIALEFSARLAETWKQYSRNGIAAYIFGYSTDKIFDLKEGRSLDFNGVRDAIINAPYKSESTGIADALEMAEQDLLQHGRPGVPKNIILITDGASDDPTKTQEAAQRLQKNRVRAFSVGVGANLNDHELLAVAAGNHDNVFNSNQFDGLLTLLQPVSEAVCDQKQRITPGN